MLQGGKGKLGSMRNITLRTECIRSIDGVGAPVSCILHVRILYKKSTRNGDYGMIEEYWLCS